MQFETETEHGDAKRQLLYIPYVCRPVYSHLARWSGSRQIYAYYAESGNGMLAEAVQRYERNIPVGGKWNHGHMCGTQR